MGDAKPTKCKTVLPVWLETQRLPLASTARPKGAVNALSIPKPETDERCALVAPPFALPIPLMDLPW